MSDHTQNGPVMDGATDASGQDKLAGLQEQVDHDHQGEAAGTAEEDLRGRMTETDTPTGDVDAETGYSPS
jgi:hypothetical protein